MSVFCKMGTVKLKNGLQCLPSFNEGSKTFDSPPAAALDSPLIASKAPESEYFSLRLEAQQSLDGSNRFRQSLPAGLADQGFPSAANNEIVETEQSDTDRKRLQGLGLYVLSTLLLSLQATTAKVLGEPLFELDFSLSRVTGVSARFVRNNFTWLYVGKRGISTSVLVMARSLAILIGAVIPLVHERPSNLWGSK